MDASENTRKGGWGLAIATLIAIIGTLAINTLSNIYPPGGQNVGEIATPFCQGC